MSQPDARFPLYDRSFEHDACGIGFVAAISGARTHRLVQLALRGLANMAHRGAVGADGLTADGAGLTLQVPHALLTRELDLPPAQDEALGVAMVFLPRDPVDAERARTLVENAAAARGAIPLGWRAVPVDESVLGPIARAAAPRIEQLVLGPPDSGAASAGSDDPSAAFETLLYAARRDAEFGLRSAGLGQTYIASMSARTVVYKALVRGPELASFYPDLADSTATSALAVFHERFATNTHPQWELAQPFRRIAHNGEVNTLLGNRAWMRAREPDLAASALGSAVASLTPVLTPQTSDTGALDEALDLLAASGRDVLEAMALLVPEAWEQMPGLDPELRAFYELHACLGEPWEGPAAVVFTDGRVVAATLDRSGLRPSRYQRTSDGLVVVGSEVGILDLPPGEVLESGRIGPGRMLAVDTRARRFMNNREIKRRIATRRPWAEWVRENLRHMPRHAEPTAVETPAMSTEELERLHVLHGYTVEEIRLVLRPMAESGKDPVGSMGDDTPLTVLAEGSRTPYSYLRQRFAQVTNPPIDSIRERLVMSLDTYLGRRGSWLEPGPEAARSTHVPTPVISDEMLARLRDPALSGLHATTLPAAFDPAGGGAALDAALEALCRSAEAAVLSGHDLVVLSDRGTEERRAPIPMLLAVSAVHHHLISAGLRTRASLAAEAGDARDVHHLAALIGFGASVVNPWLALATVRAEGGDTPDEAETNFLRGCDAGLLKIMAKMGISSVSAYRGAQIFEIIGLGESLVRRWFPSSRSPVGGAGIDDLAADVAARHAAATEGTGLDKGGWYGYRRGGDYHANEPPVWRALHDAVQGGGDEEYRAYAELVHGRPATALRDLLAFAPDREPIPLDEVEPVEAILPRFQTGAMSLGALSPEAHEDVARAMNLIGGNSNSGEGGEDPRRYTPGGELADANSRIKQVASGRFGVTAGYLAAADEIEIKMAQGSKPGEGGQLPGRKVTAYIAARRHVRPGTPLISPPPHHDIYSIEDLAQLIWDLRTVNPRARIAVKLVASMGVGTIAAGVAKAYADVIHISGADGGTGASPLSSIKNAGAPWELGLAEAQQTLVNKGLRGRVALTTDGGFHTGRDVVKAALLGAERYGFGTAALIALGCKMARQCHNNTCPVGIATQAEDLRQKYFGTPEMLVRFFRGVAGEIREILAHMGYRSVDEIVGRTDLLRQIEAPGGARWAGVDLSKLLPEPGEGPLRRAVSSNADPDARFDDRILADAGASLDEGRSFMAHYDVRNSDRTIGARLSGVVAARHGDAGLPDSRVELTLSGSAGQSLGAWLVDGVHIELEGEANDYVGKGMTGGLISIRRPERSGLVGDQSVLAGNTLLYGATGGALFVAGRVGDRFAVRNSGAVAVVEGVGKHGCEYMTGGVAVVLGPTGRNFGAGMSGGCAYVLDALGDFPARLNPMLVEHRPVTDPADLDELRVLLEAHRAHTQSLIAARILRAWPASATRFWKVVPRGVPAAPEPQESEDRTLESTAAADPSAAPVRRAPRVLTAEPTSPTLPIEP